ncbi:MAG: cardiolipin synthase [Pseudomonadota bacterium]
MQGSYIARQRRTSISTRLSVFLAGLLLAGCASLPDIRELPQRQTIRSAPTIENSQGNLSRERARSLLLQRVRGTRTDIVKLAAMEEAATGSPLIAGNRTTLLFDGPQAMGAMLNAIRDARDNINLETYIFDQDELGLQFADLLIEKQLAGVQVNILYDSIGSLATPRAFFDRMQAAGIRLIEFNPVNPLRRLGSWRLNNRDHRKILVVDGKIAFTGGVNITEDYSKSSLFRSGGSSKAAASSASGADGIGWRDTHIQLEGPAVASMQLLFLKAWASQRDGDIADREYFPPLPEVGDKLVRVLGSEPGGDFEIYKAYVLAIQEARKSIHLTAAYFAPDVQLLDAIKAAARRGVDVKIIFPSISDAGLVFHAGRSFYTELLNAGVQIFELKASVLHAKTAVVDGAWSTVGSSNMDIRSFLHNSEVNLVILSTEFGGIMESAFAEDLKNSLPVSKEEWSQRPLNQRVKEWASRNFEYWL